MRRKRRKSSFLKAFTTAIFLVGLFSVSAWSGARYFQSKISTTALAGKEEKPLSSEEGNLQLNNRVEGRPVDNRKGVPIREPEKQTNTNHDGGMDFSNKGKVVYLTFDDGPSRTVTPQILDVLKEQGVKATFFVLGNMVEQNPDILKRESNEGHAIANHSYSHNYNKLYSSTSNFLEDMKKNEDTIRKVLGEYKSKIIRFPGGSFGRTEYIKAAKEAGYNSIDWNSLNGDAEAVYVTKEKLISRFIETSAGKNTLYVLMHDANGKETTVQALPEIIKYLKDNGYEFRTLE